MSCTARAAICTAIDPLSKPRAKAQAVNSAPDTPKDATRRLARLISAARFEDLLDVAVKVDNVGKKSVTYAFEFSLKGEIIARGKVSSVCCLVQENRELKSVPIPAGIRERLERADSRQGGK